MRPECVSFHRLGAIKILYIRLIFTNETFAKFKCLNSKTSYYINLAFKYLKQNKVPCLNNLQIRFQKVNEIHSHSTRNSSNMFQKLYKQHCKSMCLSVKGTSLFNALPTNVKCSKTLIVLKIN